MCRLFWQFYGNRSGNRIQKFPDFFFQFHFVSCEIRKMVGTLAGKSGIASVLKWPISSPLSPSKLKVTCL